MHLHGWCPQTSGGVQQEVGNGGKGLQDVAPRDCTKEGTKEGTGGSRRGRTCEVKTAPGRSYTLKWTAYSGHWDGKKAREHWRTFFQQTYRNKMNNINIFKYI